LLRGQRVPMPGADSEVMLNRSRSSLGAVPPGIAASFVFGCVFVGLMPGDQ